MEKATLKSINEDLSFTVETDASDFALAATLNQEGRPVAFFSRTLSKSEKRNSSVEKEACAVVEAVKKWKHYLLGKHFKLVTDQQAVSFMFDKQKLSKIKNDKILRWRIELSCYDFDIIHRPGIENVPADAFSRSVCSAAGVSRLQELVNIHAALVHPGVTKLMHFVRSKNLNFSMEEVRKVVDSCSTCSKVKPRFYKPKQTDHLIKATRPFERLNLDFKGPLPIDTSSSAHKFLW